MFHGGHGFTTMTWQLNIVKVQRMPKVVAARWLENPLEIPWKILVPSTLRSLLGAIQVVEGKWMESQSSWVPWYSRRSWKKHRGGLFFVNWDRGSIDKWWKRFRLIDWLVWLVWLVWLIDWLIDWLIGLIGLISFFGFYLYAIRFNRWMDGWSDQQDSSSESFCQRARCRAQEGTANTSGKKCKGQREKVKGEIPSSYVNVIIFSFGGDIHSRRTHDTTCISILLFNTSLGHVPEEIFVALRDAMPREIDLD